MQKKKMYIIVLLTCIFFTCLSYFVSLFVTPANAISTNAIKVVVNKPSYCTIYLEGIDAVQTLNESSSDEYMVEPGTNITLSVVNETGIFEKWNVVDTSNNIVNNSETKKITINVNKEINVNIKYREATSSDYGLYYGNPFVVSSSDELVAIQKIINYGTNYNNFDDIIPQYDLLYKNYAPYKDSANKTNYIQNNNLFNRVVNGYYKIEHNISLFTSDFTGIGNANYPFNGVFCGKNNSLQSQIVMLINQTEKSGTSYYGLFGYLGQNSIIRNLKVNASIGISASTVKYSNQVIYGGGLAGYAKSPLIYNVNVSSSVAIHSNNVCDIYSGNIFGVIDGFGLSELNQFKSDIYKSNNVISSKGNIYAGFICGKTTNATYFKNFEVDASNYDMSIKNEATSFSSNKNIKMGLLCGETDNTSIDNITIKQTEALDIHANINAGNLYIGGICGYINTSINEIPIGKITFNNTSGAQSVIKGITSGSTSQANIYNGGLFGFVNGFNLKAIDSFKNNITVTIINEGKANERKEYSYNSIFKGDYDIRSVQNGRADNDKTYGKCVSGGLIGKGYFDINGTITKPSNIVIIKEGELQVKSVQSSIACHNNFVSSVNANVNSDEEHCVSSLFTGLVQVHVSNTYATLRSFENINMYAENVKLDTTREIGSRAQGDIYIGSFMGFSDGITFDNINMYLNDSDINCNSLSYDIKNTKIHSNNSYVGGFVGNFFDNTVNRITMNKVVLAGYNWSTGEKIGHTLGITSVQNTQPGGGDYRGENYVGGLIGQCYGGSVTNCEYFGSEGDDDFIIMRAHESPDSAFCGGMIGLLKTYELSNLILNITNNKVYNANIYGEETVVNESITTPDMYTGGLIAASFSEKNTQTININKNKIFNSKVTAIGFERTNTYAGGVCGIFTWNGSTTVTLNNNIVYDCDITSSVQASSYKKTLHDVSFAAGICPSFRSVTVTANNNMVMDTKVNAISTRKAFVYGVIGRDYNLTSNVDSETTSGTVRASQNYSNARLSSTSGVSNHYGVYKTINSGSNNYYLQSNAYISSTTSGTPLSITSAYKVTNSSTNILPELANALLSDNRRYQLVLNEAGSKFELVSNYQVRHITGAVDATETVDIWINTLSDNTTTFDKNKSVDELHELGWFKLGTRTIYNNQNTTSHLCDISNSKLLYLTSDGAYIFDSSKNKFVNTKMPYDEIEASKFNYIQQIDLNNYTVDIKLYENIPYLKFSFKVSQKGTYDLHNVFPHFYLDNETSETDCKDHNIDNLGSYELYKVNETTDSYEFEIVFYPNISLSENRKVSIKFSDGSNSNFFDIELNINLIHDEREIVGVTFAEKTPPINYKTSEAITYIDPHYILRANQTFVIIPVYRTKNDPLQRNIIHENYCMYVDYSLDNTLGGTLQANGDLKVGAVPTGTNLFTVTLVDKVYNTKSVSFTYEIVNEYDVTRNETGYEFEGIPYTSSIADYYFSFDILNGYGGKFTSFNIVIGSTTYDLLNATSNIWKYLTCKDNNENIITNPSQFLLESKRYEFVIDRNIINGNINISANLPRVYEVTFDLQTKFLDNNIRKKTFVIEGGTSFNDYFGSTSKAGKELNDWVENIKQTSAFGFVFNGFYLVDDANTISSYGESFDTILKLENMSINSSINFYARWSFLIELIEAPGTHIQTSFSSSFVQDYYDENTMTRSVIIPINMNRGYVFTVVKDDNYIGESSVKAYSVSLINGKKTIEDIIVEKYFENMNLYYITPESIKGYLVIETSVSNSDFITGENTAVISDEIIPEDGVYTFKYVVNHRNSQDEKSYIYNSGDKDNPTSNLKLTKDFLLRIYRQVYNPLTDEVELVDTYVKEGTEIEVYYQKIVNGKVVNQIVGNYTLKDSNDLTGSYNYVLLSQFTLLDKKTKAFPVETFEQFLGNNEAVSEVYYFVATPPNGYSKYANQIHNVIVEGGYYDPSQDDDFVVGARSSKELINNPLEGTISNLKQESSRQSAMYSITPSRQTILKKTGDTRDGNDLYMFTDNTKYSLLDINIVNGWVEEGQGLIYLRDDDFKHTVITSNKTVANIHKLRLKLGHEIGSVTISGSTDGVNFEFVKELQMTSSDYTLYDIDEFIGKKYQYFRIENNSKKQIRISELHIMHEDNGIMYEFKDFEPKSHTDDYDNIHYSFTEEIKNDTRHAGKSFMLACQFKDSDGNIVSDINGVYISLVNETNDIQLKPLFEDVKGRNIVYFDLSSLLNEFKITTPDIDTFLFTIIPNGYKLYNIQLLEVENVNKPAFGEIRYMFSYE